MRGDRLFDVADRLVRLYEATGQREKAAEWLAKRGPSVAPPPRPVR
jgi:hypothetical protein